MYSNFYIDYMQYIMLEDTHIWMCVYTHYQAVLCLNQKDR